MVPHAMANATENEILRDTCWPFMQCGWRKLPPPFDGNAAPSAAALLVVVTRLFQQADESCGFS